MRHNKGNVYIFPRGGFWNYKFMLGGEIYSRSLRLSVHSDRTTAQNKANYLRDECVKGNWAVLDKDDPTKTLTFKDQTDWYLNWIKTRPRKPVRDVETVEGALNKWILPTIGEMPLDEINNITVKPVIDKMIAGKLAPKTIQNYMEHVKRIVASLRNPETAEPIYMRKWDSHMMGMPEIVARKQPRPAFMLETVQSLIEFTEGMEQALYVLEAATGLRISEALAIRTDHFVNGGRTIIVKEQVDRDSEGSKSKVVDLLKTDASYRQIDLSRDLAAYFAAYMKGKTGLLFHTDDGMPFRYSYLTDYWLKPRLKAMKVFTKGMGWHSFRRFRANVLGAGRTLKECQMYWMGHEPETMTDLYKRMDAEIAMRLEESQRVGAGFIVPAVATLLATMPAATSVKQ